MTILNKQNVVNKILSDIAALDIQSTSTFDLVVLLKSALNVGERPTSIVTELHARINSVNSSIDFEELVAIVSAIGLLTTDRIVVVEDLFQLSSYSNVSAGTVYYVESENAPYIKKSDGNWVLLSPEFQPIAPS